MKQDRVEVTVRNREFFEVDRAKLAKNLKSYQRAIGHVAGLRPGQATGELYGECNAGLSSDLIATMRTVIDEYAQQTS